MALLAKCRLNTLRQRILGGLGLIALTLGLFFFGKNFFYPNKTKTDSKKIVETLTLKSQDLEQSIVLLGTLHPKHSSLLIAKNAGLLEPIILSGEKVEKGRLLAKITNPQLEKNLKLSISAVKLQKAQFERLFSLKKAGFVSITEIDDKKQHLIEAQKEVAKIRHELQQLSFHAPFDGILGTYKKREGSEVKSGEAIVSIYDPSSLVVDFDIPCTNLPPLNEKQKVYVLGQRYPLSHLQKMLDEDTHMCPADVDIQCKDCLIGQTVELRLVLSEKKNAILIPSQALFFRDSKPFVYLVEAGSVQLAAIEMGSREKEKIEIKSGLKPGQVIVSKAPERLFPGMEVEIFADKKS